MPPNSSNWGNKKKIGNFFLEIPDYLAKLSCFGASLPPLHVLDGDSLLALLQGRASRMQRQASAVRQEDAALQQESLTNGDMVFVDVVDTYRNVPSKLLQFYKW